MANVRFGSIHPLTDDRLLSGAKAAAQEREGPLSLGIWHPEWSRVTDHWLVTKRILKNAIDDYLFNVATQAQKGLSEMFVPLQCRCAHPEEMHRYGYRGAPVGSVVHSPPQRLLRRGGKG